MKKENKNLQISYAGKKIYFFALVSIVLLSGIIRFVPLLRGNVPFLFDQGRDMLAVKQIVIDHKLTLIGPFTGLQGVFQGPLHYYLLAIPFVLTHGNLYAEYGLMILLMLVGIIMCYFVGRSISGSVFGVLLAFFFAFAVSSISTSSYFWNPNWIPFCMIVFYFLLYKSLFVDPRYWFLTGFMIGTIAQFEVAFGLPLFGSVFILTVVFDVKQLKKIHFWTIIPAFLLTFFPQALFDVRHQFLMTKTILSFLHGANGGTGATILFPERFFFRVNEIQQATMFTISNNKIVDDILSIGIVLSIVYAVREKLLEELRLLLFFLIIPLCFFTLFLFYSHEAWSWYWIGLQTSYYFLIAYAYSLLLTKSPVAKSLIILFITIFTLSTILPEITGLANDWIGDTGTLKNELRVVTYTYQDTKGKPFGEFVYTPPIYDYAYQYLYWWKGNMYQYHPTQDKNGVFYLIIEPDLEHPYAIKGWKETVIKTGKTLWDKKFPGNITVEKRIGNI